MKQKFFIVLTLILTSFFVLTSKMNAEEEVLFGGKLENGGYGGPAISAGQVNDELGLFVGGRGGWIINHSFSIGFAGFGLVSNHKVKDYTQDVWWWGYNDTTGMYGKITSTDSSWYISDCGYGGLLLEYIYDSNKLIHFTGSLLIGGGNISYNYEPISMNNHPLYDYEYQNVEFDKKSSSFFVMEPAVNVEFNIAKWFRLDAGLSYRIVTNIDMPKTTNSQMSGLSGNLIFKFGKF